MYVGSQGADQCNGPQCNGPAHGVELVTCSRRLRMFLLILRAHLIAVLWGRRFPLNITQRPEVNMLTSGCCMCLVKFLLPQPRLHNSLLKWGYSKRDLLGGGSACQSELSSLLLLDKVTRVICLKIMNCPINP